MGTLRWEKESAERAAVEAADVATKLKRVRLEAEEAELEVRLRSLQTELIAKQTEKQLLTRTVATRGDNHLRELRGADTAPQELK